MLFGCYTYPAVLDRDISGAMSDMAGMESMQPRESAPNPNQMPYFPGSKIRGTSPVVEEELRKTFGEKTLTILEAVRAKCPDAQVSYEKGCDVAGDDRSGFAAAENAAKEAGRCVIRRL